MNVEVNFHECAVRGFHVYHNYWTPMMGEILSTEIDPLNPHNGTAVTVKDDGLIVGHVPMEHSKIQEQNMQNYAVRSRWK